MKVKGACENSINVIGEYLIKSQKKRVLACTQGENRDEGSG